MPTQTHSSPSLAGEWWSPRQSALIAIPEEILERYVTIAMRAATPKCFDGSDTFYCALDRFPGVWAEGASMKECLDTLQEVLRDWLFLKLIDGDTDIPVIDEIDLSVISRRGLNPISPRS